jgi:predicted lipoprotein with Yx(FWY)xxD motif
MRDLKQVGAGRGAVALLAAACGSASPASTAVARSTPVAARSSPSCGTGSTEVKTRKIGSVTVITNAEGFTLYSFAPDTSSKSNCNRTCVHYWPPLQGPATAGPGVTGKLSTIRRSGGSAQATYNGRPLYTYIGDTKPGQATGNGLSLSGGVCPVVYRTTLQAAAVPDSLLDGDIDGVTDWRAPHPARSRPNPAPGKPAGSSQATNTVARGNQGGISRSVSGADPVPPTRLRTGGLAPHAP